MSENQADTQSHKYVAVNTIICFALSSTVSTIYIACKCDQNYSRYYEYTIYVSDFTIRTYVHSIFQLKNHAMMILSLHQCMIYYDLYKLTYN